MYYVYIYARTFSPSNIILHNMYLPLHPAAWPTRLIVIPYTHTYTVLILSIHACLYGRIWKNGSLYVQWYCMNMYLHGVLAYPVLFIKAAVFQRTTSLHILRYPTLTYLTWTILNELPATILSSSMCVRAVPSCFFSCMTIYYKSVIVAWRYCINPCSLSWTHRSVCAAIGLWIRHTLEDQCKRYRYIYTTYTWCHPI